MRTNRDNRERLNDAMMSLGLLDMCAAEDSGIIGDRLKVAKLLFLATLESVRQQAKIFNFSFFRYNFGTFTPELYDTWGELTWMGLLEVPMGREGRITITPKGREVAREIRDILESNVGDRTGVALNIFRQIADGYQALSTSEILSKVYAMRVRPLGWQAEVTIKEVTAGAFLTYVLEPNEATVVPRLDDAARRKFLNNLYEQRLPDRVTEEHSDDVYASAMKGVRAAKSGGPSSVVPWSEINKNARVGT